MKTEKTYGLPEMERVLVDRLTKKAQVVLERLFAEGVVDPVRRINDELNDTKSFIFNEDVVDGEHVDMCTVLLQVYNDFKEAKTFEEQASAFTEFVDYASKGVCNG